MIGWVVSPHAKLLTTCADLEAAMARSAPANIREAFVWIPKTDLGRHILDPAPDQHAPSRRADWDTGGLSLTHPLLQGGHRSFGPRTDGLPDTIGMMLARLWVVIHSFLSDSSGESCSESALFGEPTQGRKGGGDGKVRRREGLTSARDATHHPTAHASAKALTAVRPEL